jgi:hypothetical protein
MIAADFKPGNYRFIPAVFQYSSGVTALPGYEVRRVRFMSPVPLREGFQRIEQAIKAVGRPLTAFCACELRSPAPFTDQGFRSFNEQYVVILREWGIFDGKTNPVARSNVCPELDPPGEPSFHAFSYTVEGQSAFPTFVIAGGAEAREGPGAYRERIVRYQDNSPEGMRDKGRFVLTEMERRMALFGFEWANTTAVQAYTVHDPFPFMADEVVRRGAARSGFTWHFCRPPVQGLDYEMDCRAVATELVL